MLWKRRPGLRQVMFFLQVFYFLLVSGASHGLARPDPYETIIRLNPSVLVLRRQRLVCIAVCPAGFCPSCSSFVFFVSLLWFAVAEPLLLLLSIFTFYFSSLPPNIVVLPPSSGFLSPPHPLSSLFFLLQDQTGLSCRTCWLTCGTPRTCPPCRRP